MTTAFENGVRDYREHIGTNPYQVGSREFSQWDYGWLSAQASENEAKMTDTELLPCPFCGCTEIEIHSAGKPFYFAICTNVDCEAEGPVDRGESGAIEKWNTRTDTETCEWEKLAHDAWKLACGGIWAGDGLDGELADNGWRFCPSCGKRIVVKDADA